MTPHPTIETDRLVLRPFRLADASRVQELAGAAEVAAMTQNVPHPYEDGMAERWIASRAVAFYEGGGVFFAITLKSDGALIGSVSLGVTPQHRRGELGYWIGVPFWGQGYASEAARATVRYGLGGLGLHKITSRHFATNAASGRVLEKAGLAKEGLLRDEIHKDGTFVDVVVYGLVGG